MTNQQNARREKKTFMEECAGASMQSEHANTRAKYCAQYISYSHMSLVMRKLAFCICENNDADQLRLCFRYTDSTILRVHTITKKHYIPESTFIYQKAQRKHMQEWVCMPCGILFYVCWIIKMYTCGKKRYTILKRDLQMIILLTIYVQIISC